tara:strand:- start:546 stop:2258 length:1713 start_codon:yes stop_codon:yes gene_type:complete
MNVQDAIDSLQQRVSVPSTIEPLQNQHLAEILTRSAERIPHKKAYTSLGFSLTYRDLDRLATAFASYLQHHTRAVKGDRIAIMLPNLVQYPVVFFGALKAGLVVVNTNPLYTERELVHQFNDSGAKILVALANSGDLLERVIPRTPVNQVVITELADLHGFVSRVAINFAARYVKKMVPSFDIPNAKSLRHCIKKGLSANFDQVSIGLDDIALLQYTGGTTGLSKGAVLLHKNLLSNVAQMEVLFNNFTDIDSITDQDADNTVVMPLPLYHVYACTLSAQMISLGQHCLLIPNPRDLDSTIKAMRPWKLSVFCGLNTLFVALCARKDFRALDFSSLSVTVSGGMALTSDAANRWEEVTGCKVYEGYGLTETSPVVSLNTGCKNDAGRKLGYIGVVAPSTEIRIINSEGEILACNEEGELCVRGPQVMQGYWQQAEKTAEVLSDDGWFATGDIAFVDEQGFPKIVDRKKDMIIVSGFNVYPNELEEVISTHPAVLECAVIGVVDERTGEKVKVFIVKADETLTENVIVDYCRSQLTPYKVPSQVEFIDELPKSNVGKILRRELRDQENSSA